jgi:hypothetical protein
MLRTNEKYARERFLDKQSLKLNKNSMHWILNNIDCFISQSQDNTSVYEVYLYPHASFGGHDDDVGDKVGQAVGNLQALGTLHIITHNDHDKDSPTVDWEVVARILSHVRQRITLTVTPNYLAWRAEDIRSFARAIHGHPTITTFDNCYDFPYESMDSLYSALATLPALESVNLSNNGPQVRPETESTMLQHESLTELLQVPSLRSVSFDCFYFTRALCQATANALMEGAAMTKLDFAECSFSDGECAAILANGFSRNTSVRNMEVVAPFDVAFCDALAAALPSNSMLRDLSFRQLHFLPNPTFSARLSPILSALGRNISLKTISLDCFGSIDESLCTAMNNGLGMNERLESLELNRLPLCDDNSDLWCRALSFLRTNKALKSLMVNLEDDVKASCVSAFRIEIAAMLQENTSLENLSMHSSWNTVNFKAEEYFFLVTALQHNTTLKTLTLHQCYAIWLNADERKHMFSLLEKNYALESLPQIVDLDNEARDVGAILRLNEAGRRYLIEDGSSVSKGVDVLSRVNDDINCAFLHLLENPRLCDRSAVEIVSSGENNGR